MSVERPTVGIMMPAHNVSGYIDEAITSVLVQTWDNWRLVVVDDGSVDGTANRAKSYDDSRIMVIRQPNAGCPSARNACLSALAGVDGPGAARVDYIARLDADDYWSPSHLEMCTDFLITHPHVDLVSTYAQRFGAMVSDIRSAMSPIDYMQRGGHAPVNASIVARKQVYDLVGPFKPQQFAGSDGDWNMRACVLGFIWACLPCVTYYYRRHDASITCSRSTEQRRVHDTSKALYWAAMQRAPIWNLDMEIPTNQEFVSRCIDIGKEFWQDNIRLGTPLGRCYAEELPSAIRVANGGVYVGNYRLCGVGEENFVRAYHNAIERGVLHGLHT